MSYHALPSPGALSTPKTTSRRPVAQPSQRRQRSRHTAHSRRQHENEEFERLALSLPIPPAISSQLLDKTSVVRLAKSTILMHQFTRNSADESRQYSNDSSMNTIINEHKMGLGAMILEALDGFAMALSRDATVLYVSETISIGLGLSQVEMMGNPLDLYMPADDACRLHQTMHLLANNPSGQPAQLCVRLRCSLNRRSSRQRMRCGHKVIQLCLRGRFTTSSTLVSNNYDPHQSTVTSHTTVTQRECIGFSVLGWTVIGSLGQIAVCPHVFVLSTGLDLTLQYADAKGEQTLGYSSASLSASSIKLYDLVLPQDVDVLARLHAEVLELSASGESLVRLQTASGAVLWVQATATLVCKASKATHNSQCISFLCSAVGNGDTALEGFGVLPNNNAEYQPANHQQRTSNSTNHNGASSSLANDMHSSLTNQLIDEKHDYVIEELR